jgi:hypothetical protein
MRERRIAMRGGRGRGREIATTMTATKGNDPGPRVQEGAVITDEGTIPLVVTEMTAKTRVDTETTIAAVIAFPVVEMTVITAMTARAATVETVEIMTIIGSLLPVNILPTEPTVMRTAMTRVTSSLTELVPELWIWPIARHPSVLNHLHQYPQATRIRISMPNVRHGWPP